MTNSPFCCYTEAIVNRVRSCARLVCNIGAVNGHEYERNDTLPVHDSLNVEHGIALIVAPLFERLRELTERGAYSTRMHVAVGTRVISCAVGVSDC